MVANETELRAAFPQLLPPLDVPERITIKKVKDPFTGEVRECDPPVQLEIDAPHGPWPPAQPGDPSYGAIADVLSCSGVSGLALEALAATLEVPVTRPSEAEIRCLSRAPYLRVPLYAPPDDASGLLVWELIPPFVDELATVTDPRPVADRWVARMLRDDLFKPRSGDNVDSDAAALLAALVDLAKRARASDRRVFLVNYP